MKTLENKTFATAANNWYAPTREIREKYKSIEDVVLMDTTSSAGDWNGFIIQRVSPYIFIAISFSQENNYPQDGFTLRTGKQFATVKTAGKLTQEAMVDVKHFYIEMFT